MNIEIELLTAHELRNLVPLDYSGKIQYSYVIQPTEEPHLMNTILAFGNDPFKCLPLFFFLDISNFFEPLTIECAKHGVTYEELGEYRNSKFVILSIEDAAALVAIFPIIKFLMIAEDFVMWSSDKESLKWMDEVSFKYRFSRYPPITMQFEKSTTVFSPIECGIGLTLYSNEDQFYSAKEIEKHFKSFKV